MRNKQNTTNSLSFFFHYSDFSPPDPGMENKKIICFLFPEFKRFFLIKFFFLLKWLLPGNEKAPRLGFLPMNYELTEFTRNRWQSSWGEYLKVNGNFSEENDKDHLLLPEPNKTIHPNSIWDKERSQHQLPPDCSMRYEKDIYKMKQPIIYKWR